MTERIVYITKENVNVWKEYTRYAVKFVDTYRNLLDSYVLDFFTEDLWLKLNPRWTEILESFTPTQLAEFLSPNKSPKQNSVWPLSIQAFRITAFTYTLPRKPVSSVSPLLEYLKNQIPSSNNEEVSSLPNNIRNLPVNNTSERCEDTRKESQECELPDVSGGPDSLRHPLQQLSVTWGDAALELSAAAGQHHLLQHVFRRHLKPKKQHEVARLALMAGQVAHTACDGVLVDVGSGQGHLSRLLAYGHCVRVVCLEAKDEFIKGAKKFDQQLEASVSKMKRNRHDFPALPPSPRHAVCHLEPNMNPRDFRKVVTEVWPELDSKDDRCGILGLHTCGNLASTMLRIFTNMATCQAVVSVGCCYMKLDTESTSMEDIGYPLSKFVDDLPGNKFSYAALEVACHAIEMYTERLHLGADNLKVHCYRAVLEEIITRYWPTHRHEGLRSVNNAHKMEFADYAVAAVSRFEHIVLPTEDLVSERTQHNLSRWMQVVVYYSLRLLLAPVVESVILLDRLIFLYENGIECVLIPAFDPHLSPRNHVLVAVKPTNKLVL